MVVTFLLPVVLAVGLARCAPASFYWPAVLALIPFVLIPLPSGPRHPRARQRVPARRARDILMLMGLLFAVGLVVLLRFLRPERLLTVQSLPTLPPSSRRFSPRSRPSCLRSGRARLSSPASAAASTRFTSGPSGRPLSPSWSARARSTNASSLPAGRRPRKRARPASRVSSGSTGSSAGFPFVRPREASSSRT
jgi:hypothetical protein